MQVTLLGTGAADGWPTPFCGCASCTTERAAGRVRAQTSALVDGRLLLDCGPETVGSAERAGVDLHGIAHVLVTHDHADHSFPAFLLMRSWHGRSPHDPLEHSDTLGVVGPAPVVEQWRPWVPPDGTVLLRPVEPGDRVALGSYEVRVLPAAHGSAGSTAVVYDVTSPSGRMLYATDTGPWPQQWFEAARDAAYDLVLLEETFGDLADHEEDHLDLATFPEQLRRLRAVGAVTATTDLVACHLSHHNPPTAELDRRLRAWGTRVVEDGTTLTTGQASPSPSRHGAGPRRTLLLGGARSGKSREAERILAAHDDVTYAATSYPDSDDPAWRERVRAHRARRPPTWSTVETVDLVPLLEGADAGPLLVDCVTLWLTRVMDAHGAWDDTTWQTDAQQAVMAQVDALVDAWRRTRRRVVAVTNEVGQGVVPGTDAGVRFRDVLGSLNTRLAAATEDVRWCEAGRVRQL